MITLIWRGGERANGWLNAVRALNSVPVRHTSNTGITVNWGFVRRAAGSISGLMVTRGSACFQEWFGVLRRF